MCTWKDCNNPGEIALKDKYGIEWANLCKKHDDMLNEAIDNNDVKKILSYWIKASGGADKLTEKIIK